MSDDAETGSGKRPLRTFGRRGGRVLSQRQKTLLQKHLSALSLPNGKEPLRSQDLFDDSRPLWLEIGFGGAEHLTGQAQRHPDIGFIGCEPFMEGVAKAVTQIDTMSLTNIRLYPDDAREAMAMLADGAITRCFILFPDPWPKKRQQKRRLIQPAFLEALARIVRPGGMVRFATDVKSYADEALVHFLNHERFHWSPSIASDWRTAPKDHITTRYEAKRLGDCAPVWFDFIRA